jgi:hypothetical protein
MQAPGKPRGVSGQICPIRNVDCGDANGCQVCYFWTHMEGVDPVTGDKISGYDCIEHWKVKIGLHQIRVASDGFNGVQSATESFRNEISRQQVAAITGSPRIARIMQIEGDQSSSPQISSIASS